MPVPRQRAGDLTFASSQSGRHDEAEPLGRSAEPLHGVLRERDALLAGCRDAALGLLARHAHRYVLVQRSVGLATLGKIVHLRQEGLVAGEGIRIEDLQKDVATPALLGVLAA